MLKRDLDLEISDGILVDIYEIKSILTKRLEINGDIEVNNDRHKFNTHSKTKSHLIYDFPLEWDGHTSLEATLFSEDREITEAVEPIVKQIEGYYDGKRGRVLLVNLPAGATIPEHRDSGTYLQTVRRNHVPIITNDNVIFRVGNSEINMKENYFYEINNHKTHYVENNGNQDRYHLIVDIFLNNGIRYDIEEDNGISKDI
jgi:hypothetical protein